MTNLHPILYHLQDTRQIIG